MERRFNDGLEVRAADDGQTIITGYAAVFDVESLDLGGFTEVIEPGAFSETLATNPDVRAVIEHTGGLTTLGRTTAGTLELSQDERGLAVRILPPDTQAGRDVVELVRRGDINQMSFGFRVDKEGQRWERRGDGQIQRRLLSVDIHDGDVSLVTYPAYPQTSAEARAKMNLPTIPDELAGQAPDSEADTEPDDEKVKARARLANRKRRLTLELLKGDR